MRRNIITILTVLIMGLSTAGMSAPLTGMASAEDTAGQTGAGQDTGSLRVTKLAGEAEKCTVCGGTGGSKGVEWSAAFMASNIQMIEPGIALNCVFADAENRKLYYMDPFNSPYFYSAELEDGFWGTDRNLKRDSVGHWAIWWSENIQNASGKQKSELFLGQFYANEFNYTGNDPQWHTHFLQLSDILDYNEDGTATLKSNAQQIINSRPAWIGALSEEESQYWTEHVLSYPGSERESDYKISRYWGNKDTSHYKITVSDGTVYEFDSDKLPEGVTRTEEQSGAYTYSGKTPYDPCDECGGKGYIYKEAVLTSAQKDTAFNFKLVFTDREENELKEEFDVTVTGADGQTRSEKAVSGGTLSLKVGEKAEIKGLPAGTSYEIVEEEGTGWTLDYKVEDRGGIRPQKTAEALFVNVPVEVEGSEDPTEPSTDPSEDPVAVEEPGLPSDAEDPSDEEFYEDATITAETVPSKGTSSKDNTEGDDPGDPVLIDDADDSSGSSSSDAVNSGNGSSGKSGGSGSGTSTGDSSPVLFGGLLMILSLAAIAFAVRRRRI